MITIKCAILDDDKEAVEVLKKHVGNIDYLQLAGCFTDAVEAMAFIRNSPVDLLFMGVSMQQVSGLELARILPKNMHTVLVSNNCEHAIEGYKVGIFDYLLKPLGFREFEDCVKRVRSYMIDIDEADPIRRDGYMFVKSDYKAVRIKLSEVQYIEGVKDYVKFHMQNKANVVTLMNMRELENTLPKRYFQRVHRSFIANLNLFDYTDKTKLYYGEVGIPISDSYKNVVAEFVAKHTLY